MDGDDTLLRLAALLVSVPLFIFALKMMELPVPRPDRWARWALDKAGIEVTPQLIVGAVLLGALSLLLGMVIGTMLLGVFSFSMRFEKLPEYYYYWALHGDSAVTAALAKGTGIAAVILGLAALAFLRDRESLHGDSQWATMAEIRKEGLLNDAGLIVGRVRGRLIRLRRDEHLLISAPTGMGKGVGYIIVNLLTWVGGVFAIDMKGENYQLSAGWRSAVLRQKCHRFDPANPEGKTARWNPLGHIERTHQSMVVDHLMRIAVRFYPATDKSSSFWTNSAIGGFVAVGAYVAARPELPFTIGEMLRQVSHQSQEHFIKVGQGLMRSLALSPAAQTALADFTNCPAITYGGVVKNMTAPIKIWLLDYVDYATSASDFDLSKIREEPFSVYLCTSLGDLERLEPLYNLMIQQLMDLNSKTEIKDLPGAKRCMVLLDELPQMGRMNLLVKAFALLRSYGFNLFAAIQLGAQLDSTYGKDDAKVIKDSCGGEIYFGIKSKDDSKEIEERLGYKTVMVRSTTRRWGEPFGSVTIAPAQKPLMKATDIVRKSKDFAFLFRAGLSPVKLRNIKYYLEPTLLRRSLYKAPEYQPLGFLSPPFAELDRLPDVEPPQPTEPSSPFVDEGSIAVSTQNAVQVEAAAAKSSAVIDRSTDTPTSSENWYG